MVYGWITLVSFAIYFSFSTSDKFYSRRSWEKMSKSVLQLIIDASTLWLPKDPLRRDMRMTRLYDACAYFSLSKKLFSVFPYIFDYHDIKNVHSKVRFSTFSLKHVESRTEGLQIQMKSIYFVIILVIGWKKGNFRHLTPLPRKYDENYLFYV